MTRAFTLIELLVVIAVIGTLTSIVLVSFQGTRGEARVAGGLQFSQHLHNAIGADAVGVWNFDDCGDDGNVPATLLDGSGFGNDGTNSGAVCREDTPFGAVGQGGERRSLEFNGSTQYVAVPHNESFSISEEITITAWIKPDSISTLQHIVAKRPSGTSQQNYNIDIRDGGSFETYYRNSADSGWHQARTTTEDITVGAWHHVATTFKFGEPSTMRLFVDGAERNHTWTLGDGSEGPYTSAGDVSVGAGREGGDWHFDGRIGGVRIYSRTMTAQEIQRLYAKNAWKYASHD